MKAYQLKIELIGSNPLVWRRVIIPADVTFKRLHDTIQFSMDWWDEDKYCAGYDGAFSEIEEDCLNLIDYGIQTRYPFNLELNETDAQLAIKNAEKVQNFLQGKLLSI